MAKTYHNYYNPDFRTLFCFFRVFFVSEVIPNAERQTISTCSIPLVPNGYARNSLSLYYAPSVVRWMSLGGNFPTTWTPSTQHHGRELSSQCRRCTTPVVIKWGQPAQRRAGLMFKAHRSSGCSGAANCLGLSKTL